jgi:YegS/Rv2252/BmrU family lipid kinase
MTTDPQTMPTALKFLFVINPIAGGTSKAQWEEHIHRLQQDSPHHFHLYELQHAQDHASVRELIRSQEPDRVVAVGGDGTVKYIAELLAGTNIPLGILPAGSANGMARELGLPEAMDACLDIVLNGRIKAVDIIRINHKELCLHLSDMGMNAQLVKYFEESSGRGKLKYALGIFKALRYRRLMEVSIDINGSKVTRKAYMVVLANARMYGTGAVINPYGDVSDGVFEIVLMKQISFLELIKMWLRPFAFNPKKIEILRATSIRINSSKKAYFQIDGEFRGKIRELDARIEPGSLQILVSS